MLRRFAAVSALAALLAPPGAAAAEPSVALVAPAAGATVRGDVRLVAQAAPEVASVEFSWSGDGATWLPIALDADPADGWTALWSTRGLAGPVLLRALSSLGEYSQITVVVDNVPPRLFLAAGPRVFSPNGDGVRDRATIRVEVDGKAALSLEIRDRRRRAVFRSGAARFTWAGGGARDGLYTVWATAVDAAGNMAKARTTLVLDTTPPVVSWRLVSQRYREGKPLRLSYRIGDRSKVQVRLRLVDQLGRPVRAPAGRLAVPPGAYRVALVAEDEAGNTTVTEERPVLVEGSTATRTYRRIVEAGSRVALTFDDCNDQFAWARILDTLARDGVKAAFFCVGLNVLAHPELALRVVADGHTVGSHGWDHKLLTRLNEDEVRTRLERDRDVWWDLARVATMPWFRPPYGQYDEATLRAAAAAGYARTVLWDVDPWDWSHPGSASIAARVVSHARAGSIILLHVQGDTADALPAILAGLREKGLEPVGLPELFEA